MIAERTFGQELERLLLTRNVNAGQLAQAMEVDKSLVYRWLRDDRTPKVNSRRTAQIARLLGLSAVERDHMMLVQVRTLREQLARPPRVLHAAPEITRLVARRAPAHDDSASVAPLARVQPTAASTGVISGYPQMLSSGIEMLQDLPRLDPGQSRTIQLSFQGGAVLGEDARNLLAPWQDALRTAMQRNWMICHLARLDRNVRRSIQMVENMLDLIGSGGYFPRYFRHYGVLCPPYDLMLVPGVGARIGLAARKTETIDSALVIDNPRQVKLLEEHFARLCEQTEPLFDYYLPDKASAFWKVLAEAEDLEGGRVLVKSDLSLVTEPLEWSREDSYWAQSRKRAGVDIQLWIANRRQRLKAFARHIERYRYRDICPKRAIERLVSERAYLHTIGASDARPVPQRDVLAHLQRTIEVLERYKNFELALVDANEEQRIPIADETFWEVMGGSRALINTRAATPAGETVAVDLAITESTMTNALQQYFEQLWERTSPRSRDKAHVIAWLRAQIERLR